MKVSSERKLSLEVVELEIPDVKLITPRRFTDARGFFVETYTEQRFIDVGINVRFVQDNHSFSVNAGTIRGLHYQSPPFSQTKLVRVLAGSIIDVAVDVRKGSPYFGNWVRVELSAESGKQIYIPSGFLHGFVTLEPNTEVAYKVDAYYSSDSDGAVRWDDETLGIDWGISRISATVSEKDQQAPSFTEFESPFTA